MAKKNDFNLFNAIDESLLDSLQAKGDKAVAPTEKEVEIIKTAEGDVKSIPLEKLKEYHNHSYKVLDNEDMATLVDSIKDYGILLPLIVREVGGGKYEVVSGHRRMFAAKKLGLKEVPCKVMELDDDMADIMMADTNIARETILPSEKAKTYKVRLDAAVRQGKKTVEEINTIAEDAPDSARQIQRYLKLNDLSPALLDQVDEGVIPVTAGVTLADLSKEHQKIILDVSNDNEHPVSLKEAERLKKASARGLTKETVEAILVGDMKPRAKKPKKETFKEDMLLDIVPASIKGQPLETRVAFYRNAIKAYKKSKKS